MTFAIEVINLRKTYPRSWNSAPFEALKGVSLEVAEGEVFGFIGGHLRRSLRSGAHGAFGTAGTATFQCSASLQHPTPNRCRHGPHFHSTVVLVAHQCLE